MTLLRAIRDDLVDKRLWPVALALLIALIAVPVVLARSGSAADTSPLPDPNAQAPAVAGTAAQPVVLQETRAAKPHGAYHDPFRKRPGQAAATASEPPSGVASTVTPDAAAAASSGLQAASAGASVGATATGTSTATGTTTTAPAAAPAPNDVAPAPAEPTGYAAGYRVDWSWGPTGAPERTRNAMRLAALRADADPALLFLGVRPDGRTALFSIVPDAAATGDARCRPTVDLCHLIELRAGDTEFLDVQTADGIVQHELHLDRVVERRSAAAGTAKRLRARVSKAGRKLLAATVRGGRTFVRRFVYVQRRGVVVFSEHRLDKRAGTASLGDLAAVPAEPGQ